METKNIIEVENLSRSFSYFKKQPGLWSTFKNLFHPKKLTKKAVKKINFKIKKGEFVGFLGPNGAGKTTTLKMLAGILTPTSGKAGVLGFSPWERKEEYQKQFAMVMGQKSQLWWDLPAMDSFLLNKAIYEIPDEEFFPRVEELSGLLDIKKILHKQVRQLSLGERMKCELVASILHRPKVLFLDEPTIGLDVVAQKNIRDFLKKYNEENQTTILLTSHYMGDIAKLCKRIIIIDRGSIIYDGPIEKLIKKYAVNKGITIHLESEVEEKSVAVFGKIHKFEPLKISLEIPREKIKEVAAQILSSNLPIKDIDITEPTVENIIRNIFKRKT